MHIPGMETTIPIKMILMKTLRIKYLRIRHLKIFLPVVTKVLSQRLCLHFIAVG
jgi:hypothetical protein